MASVAEIVCEGTFLLVFYCTSCWSYFCNTARRTCGRVAIARRAAQLHTSTRSCLSVAQIIRGHMVLLYVLVNWTGRHGARA